MKKNGFTLAEVLITLGIIGVVAALTLPTITANTQNAKIGPKLAKAASTYEQANEALLNASSVDSLVDLYKNTDSEAYAKELTNYMKASEITTKNSEYYLIGNDGVDYKIALANQFGSSNYPPHKRYIGSVTIDINGKDTKPNDDATDVFYFGLFADGSLAPYGGKYLNSINYPTWQDKCPKDAVPKDRKYCAGHIFENNLKVLYK